jgi:hypothetical protein
MHELFTALLALLIALMGLAMMVGFSPRSVLRTGGKWGVLLFFISLLVMQVPAFLEQVQRHPPRSVQEVTVWGAVVFALFLVLLRVLFGPGAVSRFFERMVTAAVYDLLKGLGKFLLGRRR